MSRTFIHPLDQVKEFHQTFGCPISEKAHLPSAEERDLRKRLLAEEYQEYLVAEAEDNLVEIADALCDAAYIICGTALSYGIPLDVIFNEVHRSNMSKLDENGNVLRRDDGKILKSDLFSPPGIRAIIEKYS